MPTSPALTKAPRSVSSIITPAIAGPFDLGVVVVRAAVGSTPKPPRSARLDPLPQILDGIPLDLRSVAVKRSSQLHPQPDQLRPIGGQRQRLHPGLDRPAFSPFQVGGCQALLYKPKLTTRLFWLHRPRRQPQPSYAPSAPSQEKRAPPRSPLPCLTRSSSTKPTSARSAPACSSPPTSAQRAPSTATSKRPPRCWTTPRRPGLPALLEPPAARRRLALQRPASPAGRDRPRPARSTRLTGGSHPLRSGPRRSGLPRRSSACRAAARGSLKTPRTSARAPTARPCSSMVKTARPMTRGRSFWSAAARARPRSAKSTRRSASSAIGPASVSLHGPSISRSSLWRFLG